uniref:EF-hand domain-containing protein n=1 Tax=Parastrongyloides trichosuri TaxID=131310 RepID=A0A0N4ZMU2_PARTI
MDNDTKILSEAIDQFDDVGDGCIYVKDVGKTLRNCGLYPSEESIKKQLISYENTPDARVNVNDLLPMYNELKKDPINNEDPAKSLDPILNLLDPEGTGSFKISELRLMLETYGEQLTSSEMDTILLSLPVTDDGFLSKEIFIKEICFDTY